jgi:ribose transport system ATP-binding protein
MATGRCGGCRRAVEPVDSAQTRPSLLSVRGLTKAFWGSLALAGVDLDVGAGEVHGLVGENGSGKSTLIKVLAGYHQPDTGELMVGGQRVNLPLAPGEPRRLGFAFVHQDLALIPTLTVSENLFIDEIATSRAAWMSRVSQLRRAERLCRAYNLEIDPAATVADLEPVERALLAIVRAVQQVSGAQHESAAHGGLLVLDEPTVFLPKEQVDQLFGLMRRIAAQGSSVLFVSHDLGEVLRATDRVTVLRDGRVVGTAVTRYTDVTTIVKLIVGRDLPHRRGDREIVGAADDDFVRVNGLVTGRLREVSFSARRGEILGLTGLIGSGYDEVVYALFGAGNAQSGSLRVEGVTYHLPALNPSRAMTLGISLIPGDRHVQGAISQLSITDNLTSVTLNQYFRRCVLRRRGLHECARRLSSLYDIRPADPELEYGVLSGGNQQKALLAKWLQLTPRILLLHEPTQGVDVGARRQIFDLLRSARHTRACICASSDHEQLAELCDRVLICGRGRIVEEIKGGDLTAERITAACLTSTHGVRWA